MRRLLPMFLLALVVGMAVVLHTPQSAHADERDFVLINSSGATFTEVYVSSSGTDDWEENLLSYGYVLLPNYKVNIHFPRYAPGYCLYDILVVGANGESGELDNIDLCSVDTVTFH